MSTIHETYPLSPIQKGILFHSLEQTSNGVYLQQFICNLNENINIEAFEQAWQKVIERHAVLRTGFQWQDLDEPQQIVYEQVNCPLHFEDWSDIYDPEIQLAAYLESDKKQGFDLSEAPLIRLTLFKFNDNDYRFIWTHHHIILDGRSYFILFKELFNIYKTFNENKELELGKVYPYSEYIEWLEQQNFFKSEPFWRKSLSGVEAPTPLIKNVEYVVEEEAYLEKTYDFSETLTEGLKFFAEENGLTLNTLVQAAWAILLSRYSGEDKVIFGATRACRHWTKIEPNNRVGIFINTLPFCTQLDANMDVLTWLNSLRSHWVDMREHEHTPLTQIQQWSDIRGDSPLFESILVFENADLNSTLRAQGGDWEKRNFTLLQKTNYPLVLAATVDSCLHLMLEYETARFDTGMINRMFGHLQTILSSIIANPTQNLSEISLLTKLEKDQLLVEWNNTAADFPLDKCVHQLFEEQVEKTPDAIAVKFEDQQLTYSELNARANQLAHHLDVKPDTLVGLSVERSLEMIVGMLGILKAGAAYVPLDPNYPEERLNFILEDSGIEIILDKEALEQIDEQNIENPSTDVKPNNLAYVIYTSGSTGKPKGVLIEHKSLVNHTQSARNEFELNEDDRVLQFASMSFDAAAEEIYPCLITGATLVLRTNEMLDSISIFLQKCKSWGLTLIDLPTAYWHEVTSQLNNENRKFPSSVRLVIIGGEQALKEQLVKWQKYVNPTVKLFNTYGPTEATIVATRYLATNTLDELLIGKPIDNLQNYILDNNQHFVPIGVAGELHIGGVGLARGYLNRPELTAEKFVSIFNQRLYKTGDLVRYLPDGNIEFLGRIDNQVKIRGFRIELGEIESVIMKHVSEAAVIVREDQPGNKRLVAYTVGSTEGLRDAVKAELPHYMVPSAFVSLEKMPLTPNGKIDRRALPVPDQTEFEAKFVAPRNSVEEKIAKIWKEILVLKQVGIHDNFFELGGHSLLATQVVSRLSVTLQNLFENPTVAELAEIINSETKEIAIIPRSDQHDVVSFAQQRLWFIDQLEPNTGMYNIPAAFKITGNLNIARLEKSLNTIVERHEIIRTILKTVDGKPVPVVLDNVSVDLPVIKLNDEAEIQNLINEEATRPFDISTDLMLRATLLEVNSNEFVLILVMHHIASDGWSFGILFDEFVALYQGNTLPELAIQYSDFAVWQRQYLSDQVLETQLSYWKQQLEGMPTTLELPIDRQRPATQTTNGKTRRFVLPVSLANKLKTLSQQQGLTLFMTLLGAFKILLHRYTNQDDIVVGSPIAGRNQSELEDLIGFFVNTLVLRSKINRDSNFIEFLGHVREVALGAYAHQDVPFDKLVSELKFERDVSRHPLFQVMFDLQNANQQDLQLPDLSIKPLLADNDTAKFDLLLDIVEEANSELTASFEYNTDLFDESTIERMMVHFQTLLESIVANPKQSISELEILDKAEKDQLLVEWNNTAADYPLDKCVHQLFEEQVEKTPDAIAVKFEDQQLTYSELNARANQVAHHLDVKPDTLVGLSVERSLEMIVGMLGILKAGAAYVPLDPNYPEERLNFILEDSGIEIILDKEALEQIDEQNIENPSTDVKPNNLAYVIYTSGSTGKPKGVLIEHKSLVNHTQSARNEFELNEDDRVLQFASMSFDAAAEEIYPCLITGATLVLRTNEMLDSISIFLQKCKSWGLTLIDLPTAYWHEVTSQLNNENRKFPSSVRLVIIGGEQALKEQLVKWQKYVNPTVKLFNTYGPTEATIVATRYLATNTSDELLIGRPIDNLQNYILDKNQQIVPIGVPGELHIGGVGLARGYLNRPELTAEKFISIFNQRLYKTGDLVRYLPDGNIEFLGRIDNQVKIRGFRIELGEIESVIMKHVSEAAVIVREDQLGNKRLVAYTVGSTDDLRDAVKEELPHYMVPSAFVSLEKMPLTPNGKIDRRALPMPTAEIKTDFVAPRDQLEQQLADIWQQVLGVDSISVHENFFDLGGHSLLAITLLGKIEQAFDKAISVIKLFQAPTIAQFADILRDKDHTPTWRALLPIQTQGQRKPLFFIGSTDYARLLVPSLGNEQPVYGLNMFGLHSEGDTNPVLTVETMATEYLQEIRIVQPEGPYHLCGYCADAKVAFEMAQQLNKQGQEVAYLGFIDADLYADSSLSLNQRASKLGKNIAKFGPSFITHKIKGKLKARKESKVLSQSAKDKQDYERSGESLPLQLQHQFLINAFWNALDDYQAQTYSGNLNLLLSSELISEWEIDKNFSKQINSLVTGTVTVEEVPGFHDTLFAEPQVSALGKQIKLHLESLVYK